MSNTVLLIDAMNVFMRHYIANPAMSSNGFAVGGIVGFLKNLASLSRKYDPKEVHIVWEGGGSTRRRDLFPDYKKGRKPIKMNRFYEDDIPDTEQNRIGQTAALTKCLKRLPVYQHYVSDCEADDVIAYAAKYIFPENELVIVSSDKDYYQLINNRITVWSPGQKREIKEEDVLEKLHVHPQNVSVARSFVGDHSDNIPGVDRVGLKSLSNRFKFLKEGEEVDLDDVFKECERLAQTSKARIYANILENRSLVQRNYKLMHLDVTNLSGDQIQKLKGSFDFEIREKNYDKIGFLRCLKKQGIINFDPSALFLSMNILNRR